MFGGVFWEDILDQSVSEIWKQLEDRMKEGTTVVGKLIPSAILVCCGTWV